VLFVTLVVLRECGYRKLQGPWSSRRVHLGLLLCLLYSTAVFRQGGMIH